MKRIIFTVVIVIAALAGIVYILNKNKTKNEAQTAIAAKQNAAVSVRTSVVDFHEVNSQYVANGMFEPKQEVKLSSETSGKVLGVLVDEGARVHAGQVLAIINGDKQSVNLANTKAALENARAEVQRFESAFATGGVTKQQLDQVKLQLTNAENNMKSAQIAVSDINVKASFSGVVNKRNIEPGSFVSPGQELFNIVNVSSLKLKVNVDEKNVGQLKVGQTVKVEAAVLSGKSFNGVISFIAPVADGSLNFPVELEIRNNSNSELKAGMYGTAYFGDEITAQILVVSRNAFVGSVSTNQIFVVQNGKAILKNIVSGRSFGDYIEVVSGLEKGDQVIISGQINLLDGTPVEVIK